MPVVVGVVFAASDKVYQFDAGDLRPVPGDRVVVQTLKGTEIGEVVRGPQEIASEDLPAPLKKVIRMAGRSDLVDEEENEARREEAFAVCRRLIAQHGLPMKLVDADLALGGGKVTFSFYSEERVDFRALVADLAKQLRMRIELRQIGSREEARILGGLGPCGRHLCCTLFRGDQEPVSIRMAKEQNLPLNPSKISGLCGRLMCCLKYEQEQYSCFYREAPRRNSAVMTPKGEGIVVGYQVPANAVVVRLEDGTQLEIALKDIGEGDPADELVAGSAGAPGCACRELAEESMVADAGPTGVAAETPGSDETAAPGGAGDESQPSPPPRTQGRPRRRRRRPRSLGGNGGPGGDSGS